VSYYTKKIDENVITLLSNGGVGLLPTDTIYGLSAVALDEKAVGKVHELKSRDNKPFIVLISDVEQLPMLGIKAEEADPIKGHWPGMLSVIFESSDVPKWLQLGTNSLAVRMPGSKDLRGLIAITGPIISTSANLQGQAPAKNVERAKKYFGDSLDFYVDAGELEGKPSTLVKIDNESFKIIRRGAYELP
jgi:L-threonylcarbamoyladenylate synthase